MRTRCGRARALRTRRRVGLCRADRHERARACAVARHSMGRERRHGDQLRSLHLPAACVPARARRSEAGLVGDREVARRMGYATRVQLRVAHTRSLPSMRRSSGVANDGRRAFDLGALADHRCEQYEALEPMQWPVPTARSRGYAAFDEDGVSITPMARPVSSRHAARTRQRARRGVSRSCSTRAGFATSGTR